MTEDSPTGRVRIVRSGEGEALWFLAGRLQTKADVDLTEGRFVLYEQQLPAGDSPPRHVHQHDDEGWYFLEGDATFLIGGTPHSVGAGDFVFAPRGIEHTFLIGQGGARVLLMTAPGSFAHFVQELATPATGDALPGVQALGPDDVQRLAEICARHGITLTGPPPSPAEFGAD